MLLQTPTNMQDTIEVVKSIIKPDMHEYLQQDFTAIEVFEAIRQMKSSAAPRPDGLLALFYQSHWAEIGTEIIEYALNILNNNGDPGNINHTFLCLIPKVKKPTLPSDFRPIALCNVILKIITKTIANRIKKFLPSIISPQQSAFLSNKFISNNTILAYEAFHFLKKRKNKKSGVVGIKLDMEKTYDRVEWDFLKSTLLTMGFPIKIVKTIMLCVRSVSFSILINGSPSTMFKPKRGIRQGDPLSPYLFIICAEVLSGLITKYHEQDKIHGISIAIVRNAPVISHLFFSDDSMMFAELIKMKLNT